MSKVLQRQVVVVHRQLDATEQSFSFNLGLRFSPTKVIIRTISYGKNAQTGENYVSGIIYPWSNGEVSDIFIDDNNGNFCSNPNTTFHLKSGSSLLNGDATFIIKRLTDTEAEHDVDGLLGITIEFIQEDIPEPKPKTTEIDKLINFLKTEKASRDIYPFNPVSVQKGGCHMCMCGGQAPTQDDRNALNQIDPIPDIHTDMTAPEDQVVIETQPFEDIQAEEGKQEEAKKE